MLDGRVRGYMVGFIVAASLWQLGCHAAIALRSCMSPLTCLHRGVVTVINKWPFACIAASTACKRSLLAQPCQTSVTCRSRLEAALFAAG